LSEPALSIEAELVPLLRAAEHARFYGRIALTYERGTVFDIEINQRMRLRDQVRLVIKRMLQVAG